MPFTGIWNLNECFFMCDLVEYLGHVVYADGICATPEKVVAIEKLPLTTEHYTAEIFPWVVELSQVSIKHSK